MSKHLILTLLTALLLNGLGLAQQSYRLGFLWSLHNGQMQVDKVDPNGPAQGQLQVGEVITDIDGCPLTGFTSEQIRQILSRGSDRYLLGVRASDGRRWELLLTPEFLHEGAVSERELALALKPYLLEGGLNAYAFTGISYDTAQLNLIKHIRHNSPAWLAGLMPGDRILSIERNDLEAIPLESLGANSSSSTERPALDYIINYSYYTQGRLDHALLVEILRGEQRFKLKIKPEWRPLISTH